jgi:hypothetical protein
MYNHIIQHFLGELINGNLCQHFFVTISPPWILIGFFYQVMNGIDPITRYRSRRSECGTNKFIIHHQCPEIKTGNEFFYYHIPPILFGGFKSL